LAISLTISGSTTVEFARKCRLRTIGRSWSLGVPSRILRFQEIGGVQRGVKS
jgi:hypothetical protein